MSATPDNQVRARLYLLEQDRQQAKAKLETAKGVEAHAIASELARIEEEMARGVALLNKSEPGVSPAREAFLGGVTASKLWGPR